MTCAIAVIKLFSGTVATELVTSQVFIKIWNKFFFVSIDLKIPGN
jgi:hypothetical protein